MPLFIAVLFVLVALGLYLRHLSPALHRLATAPEAFRRAIRVNRVHPIAVQTIPVYPRSPRGARWLVPTSTLENSTRRSFHTPDPGGVVLQPRHLRLSCRLSISSFSTLASISISSSA
ncbi:hypothetical protein GGR58DRAFT_347403 [Xylaria digitata]|nr:hypothetical protein GGR58DRAFT_347403 [Xylaria digitata]